MHSRFGIRLAGFVATVGAAAVMVAATVASTGAYFSDTKSGSINGTFGNVSVATSGGSGANSLDFTFTKMLPAEWKTAKITVTNTGTGPEDIWMVFDNANKSWSWLNSLGTYGEMTINGKNYNNLNNKYPQGTPSPGYPPIAFVPAQNKIGTLAPGLTYTFEVKFRWTYKTKAAALQNGPAFWTGNPDNPVLDTSAPGPLTYAIVATQPGITPDNQWNTTQFKLQNLPKDFYAQ